MLTRDDIGIHLTCELVVDGATWPCFSHTIEHPDGLVLVEGEADVTRKGRVVNELGPGDFIGEIALVSGKPRTATVKTRGPARILVLTASAFRTLMHDVPSIQDKVLAAVTARLPDD